MRQRENTDNGGRRGPPALVHGRVSSPAVVAAAEIVERAKSAAVATSGDNKIAACNRRARALLGCEIDGCKAGKPLYRTLEARDPFGNLILDCHLSFLEVLSRGETVRNFEIQATAPSGDVGRLAVSVVIVVEEGGDDEAFVYFLEPVLRRRRADEAIERLLSDPRTASVALGERTGTEQTDEPLLTPRQLDILARLADGLSDEEIASSGCISIHTVRNHIRAILAALEVRNRAQAVARAFRERLI